MTEHAPLELERFLPYRLSILSNRVSQAIARDYQSRFDLSMTEWRVMAVLARFDGDGLSASEVAARTEMDKVAVSRALARLVAARRVARSHTTYDTVPVAGSWKAWMAGCVTAIVMRFPFILRFYILSTSRSNRQHLAEP